jgi:hypothetical protein
MLEDMLRALAHNEQRDAEARKALDNPAGPYGLPEKSALPPRKAVRSDPSSPGGLGQLLSERQRFIALQALLALAFFFLGRASVGIVRADPVRGDPAPHGSTPPVGAGREQSSRASAAGSSGPSQPAVPKGDEPLYQAANRYTVQAITYGDTELQRGLAWETHRHLRESGFPVFTPYRHRGKIVILVGASAAQAELDPLIERLRKLESPRGELEFGSAFVVPIENYLQR